MRDITNNEPSARSAVELTSAEAVEKVRSAWKIMVNGAPEVAEEMLRLATRAKSEKVRVEAGTAVMDRIGLGKQDRSEVAVRIFSEGTGDSGPIKTASQIIEERLNSLRSSTQQSNPAPEPSDFPDLQPVKALAIIEGEIVPEPVEFDDDDGIVWQ